MSGGCTDCGKKGGCESRKSVMLTAVDEALASLYPTRCWNERVDPPAPFVGGVAPGRVAALAERLSQRLKTLALYRPGGPEEYCDFIDVLCLGRQPSLLEVREGLVAPEAAALERPDDAGQIHELYLRVAVSALVPFAAVQQVSLRLASVGDEGVMIEEETRAGVFDPVLLKRFRTLVSVLAETEIRHLDFGEISAPPPDFDPGDWGERDGGSPAVANYLFFPQPCSSITTTVLPLGPRAGSAQLGDEAAPSVFT